MPSPARPIREEPLQRLLSAPEDELGVALPAQQVLSTGVETVVLLTGCVAFTTGFQLGVGIRRKHAPPPMTDPRDRPKPPEMSLDVSVRFADGRGTKRSPDDRELSSYYRAFAAGYDPPLPPGPVMGSSGGTGGLSSWDLRYWIWPLPPDGPVTITCEWPAGGVPDGSAELDGSAIRRAGESSQRLWTD
jgi:hypothetical protein